MEVPLRLLPCLLLLVACAPEPGPPGPVTTLEIDPVAPGATEWSGDITWDGVTSVGRNDNVVLLPGTVVTIEPGSRLEIEGRLTSLGTAEEPVLLDAPGGWSGIELDGTLDGTYLTIRGVGGDLTMNGGLLRLIDSVLDLETVGATPDCTKIYDGAFELDHVQITGCHCPIHINSADSVQVTNSVFDDAAVPVMIRSTSATFHGNHFIGEPGVMDIGGNLAVDLTGNYWGGGTPTLSTGDPSQFTGVDDFLAEPVPDAGPR